MVPKAATKEKAPKVTDLHRATPHLVRRARRGAELKAIIKAAKDELVSIDEELGQEFASRGVRTLTNASGEAVAILNHAEPNRLDQKALKEAHPGIVKEFTRPMPYDNVSYVAP